MFTNINMNDFEKFCLSKNPYCRSSLDSVMASQAHGLISPYILEERKLNVAQLDIYSRLQMDRILVLNTQVTPESANILVMQLLYLENTEPGKDINLYISSPGGSVLDGYGVIDTMNFISSPVATTVVGMAASMGALILSCGTKGKRSGTEHSRIMIHQVLGGASGQASDIEIECKEILKLKEEINQMLTANTGQPYEKIVKDCDRNYWMTSAEGVEYGIIDRVIQKKA